MELIKLIIEELKKRGNKTVKSVFWNRNEGNLSVFPVGYKGTSVGDGPKSFNITPDVEWSVDEICDRIEAGILSESFKDCRVGDCNNPSAILEVEEGSHGKNVVSNTCKKVVNFFKSDA